LFSFGTGLGGGPGYGGPRRRPGIARFEHAQPKRDAGGKFAKKTNDDKGRKR
jgi:hypothetical protein